MTRSELRVEPDPGSRTAPLGRQESAGWKLLLWAGLGIAAGALLIQAIVFGEGFGGTFWVLSVPIVVAGALTWRATSGSRVSRQLLLVASLLLIVLGGAIAIFAIGLSMGQSPLIELIAWPLVPLGGVVMLIGSILSLR